MHPEALTEKAQLLFPELKKFRDFYLAGGTALALQIGHRISVDFDLFSENDIPKNLLDKAKNIFGRGAVDISVNNIEELTFFVNQIKISFLKYPFPVLSGLVDFEDIKLLGTKEIAVTKAYAIGRRGTYKDYVDIYFAILDNYISLDEIIKMAEKKYKNEFNSRLFLEQLVYLDDIEDTQIIFLKKEVDKNELKSFFEEEIKKIKI
ncbi:nucleotidyl transferase AbiEii/AbiGii toxin family protein [Patescibacteria group bacterium]|nr:nucleotidyl transferase AbiEii/AbiGii toxin family protein [Patescibacteria group bacterium]